MAQDIPVEVENPLSIFNIIKKEDSAEKLAYLTGNNVPNKNVIFAPEFNLVKEQAIQSALDNMKFEFYWSRESNMSRISNNPYLEAFDPDLPQQRQVRLLGLKIENQELLNYDLKVHIKRYRPIRRTYSTDILTGEIFEVNLPAGYKSFGYHESIPLRLPVIPINHLNNILDFGADYFFRSNIRDGARATGMTNHNSSKAFQQAQIYLSFSFSIKIGQKTYHSKELEKLTLVYNNSVISYKKN